MTAMDCWCGSSRLLFFSSSFSLDSPKKYKRFFLFDFCTQLDLYSFDNYLFCFWYIKFIFYFISFKFFIQFDPHSFDCYFLINFLIYLCFSILSLNILFYLILIFNFDPHSFDYYFLSLSWFIYVFQFCPSTFYLI
jgi:hypothetical protein